jgi:hypothetical protein
MDRNLDVSAQLAQANAVIDRALARSVAGSAVPKLVEYYHALTDRDQQRALVAALAMRVVAAHDIKRMSER